MLTERYIEALLADEALADEVWAVWDQGLISNELAAWAQCLLAVAHANGTATGHTAAKTYEKLLRNAKEPYS